MNKTEELKQKLIDVYFLKKEITLEDLIKLLQLYADEQSREKPLASVIIKPNCIKVHGGENEAFEIAMKELHKRYILWALGEKPRIFRFEMYIESNQEENGNE